MEKLTLEIVENWNLSVYETLKELEKLQNEKPQKPIEPKLKENHNHIEILEYANDFGSYNEKLDKYNKELENWKERYQYIENLIEIFIKKHSNIEIVPEKYREKLWNYIYNDNYSYGMFQVYLKLNELIEIFE